MRAFYPALMAAAIALSGAAAPGVGAADPAPSFGPSDHASVLSCSGKAEMAAHLKGRYGETPAKLVENSERGEFELYASMAGTWTLVLNLPDGQTCPIAVGDDVQRDWGVSRVERQTI